MPVGADSAVFSTRRADTAEQTDWMATCKGHPLTTFARVILAEFDVWHTRPVAPTRRVALGDDHLPMDPAPGFGGLLLGAVVAIHAQQLDEDLRAGFSELMGSLERGQRVSQPRLRHRLQQDRVGLMNTTHRLVGRNEKELVFELEPTESPEPHLLAAAYRAAQEPDPVRRSLFTLLQSAVGWRGPNCPDLVAYLTGRSPDLAWATSPELDPLAWALQTLEIEVGDSDRRTVQRQFRRLLRSAHPDHGGAELDAGARIQELSTARRILLDRKGA